MMGLLNFLIAGCLIAAGATSALTSTSAEQQVHNSLPYVVPSRGVNASTSLIALDLTNLTQDERAAAAVLSGLFAQVLPAVYLIPWKTQGSRDAYKTWLTELTSHWGNVTIEKEVTSFAEFLAAVVAKNKREHIIPRFDSFVVSSSPFVFDQNHRGKHDEGFACACMYASINQVAVAPSSSVAATLRSAGLAQVSPMKFENITVSEFFLANKPLMLQLSRDTAVLQFPQKFPYMVDYAVAAKAALWWSTNSYGEDFATSFNPAAKENQTRRISYATFMILNRMRRGRSAILGWGSSEFTQVTAASTGAVIGVNAADWSINLPVFAAYPPVSWSHGKKRPKVQRSSTFSSTARPTKHQVAFFNSDGDNLQMMLGGFFAAKNWWSERDCSSVENPRPFPFSWSMSPAMFSVGGPALNYARRTMTANDSWIGSPSGYAYSYPSNQMETSKSDFQTYADLSAKALFDAYSEDSDPAQVVLGQVQNENQGENSTEQDSQILGAAQYYFNAGIRTVVWQPWQRYDGLKGYTRVSSSGHVLTSPRHMFWPGVGLNQTELIAALNNNTTVDPSSEDGYTIVVVEYWGQTMKEICEVVKGLDEGKIEVVSIAEMASNMRRFIKPSF